MKVMYGPTLRLEKQPMRRVMRYRPSPQFGEMWRGVRWLQMENYLRRV